MAIIGDRVKLKIDLYYLGSKYPAGTEGVIVQLFSGNVMELYPVIVRFNNEDTIPCAKNELLVYKRES